MGAFRDALVFSPSIKERRDYSCAVFNAAGEVLAMGDHMPVTWVPGAMSVRAAIDALKLESGDIAMLNNPFRGGTHLPDITVVAPVFVGAARCATRRQRAADFFVAARAHHADIGGNNAGSMGPCRETTRRDIFPPVKIVRGGQIQRDVMKCC